MFDTPADDDQADDAAGRAFDDYEASGVVPGGATPAANGHGETPQAALRPALTIVTIDHPLETIAIDGTLYELRLLYHYTLGQQTALIGAYNAVLAFMRRDEVFDALDGDEEAQRRFLLERLARAAVPDLPTATLARFTNADLEGLALGFFGRTREIRDAAARGAATTAGPPTSPSSSPASNASTAGRTRRRGSTSTPASSTPTRAN